MRKKGDKRRKQHGNFQMSCPGYVGHSHEERQSERCVGFLGFLIDAAMVRRDCTTASGRTPTIGRAFAKKSCVRMA